MPDTTTPPAWNGIYGVLDRATFEAHFYPISDAEHVRAFRWALRHDTYAPHHDVLMETYDETMVSVLPADCMPYAWRTFWRQKETS